MYKSRSSNEKETLSASSQKEFSNEKGHRFIDNRSQTLAQLKLINLAQNSPKVKQLMAIQKMADEYANSENKLFISPPVQRKKNNTGLPDDLKSGIENLSGYSMDDVNVHYNSDKPAQMNAHAYAQGSEIHLASGQEKHLAHEAWHTVQQKQGRVKPTTQVNGVAINDNQSLEKEADLMGTKALQMKSLDSTDNLQDDNSNKEIINHSVVQRLESGKSFSYASLGEMAESDTYGWWNKDNGEFVTPDTVTEEYNLGVYQNEIHYHQYNGELKKEDDKVSIGGHAVWAKQGNDSRRRLYALTATKQSGGHWSVAGDWGALQLNFADNKNPDARTLMMDSMDTFKDIFGDAMNESDFADDSED